MKKNKVQLIRRETEELIEGEKRQHFPYILEIECTKCEATIKRDFMSDYLSYPSFGEVTLVSFRCMVCGHEGEVLVRPNVTLDIVDNYGRVLPEPENDDRELFNVTIDALAIRLTEAIFERDQIAARRNTLVERYEHFREQMQTQMKLTSRIREVLYPGGDVDHEWSTYELDAIAKLLEVGIGKDKVIPKSVQDEEND